MAYTPIDWSENIAMSVAVMQSFNDEIVRLGTLLNVKISVQATAPASPATNQLWLWPDIAKRWTGAAWVNITIAERWTGAAWANLTISELWTSAWERLLDRPLYDNGAEYCNIQIDTSEGVGTVTKEATRIYIDSGAQLSAGWVHGSWAYCTFVSPIALNTYNRMDVYFSHSVESPQAELHIGTAKQSGTSYTGIGDHTATPVTLDISAWIGTNIVFSANGVTEINGCESLSYYASAYINEIRLYNA